VRSKLGREPRAPLDKQLRAESFETSPPRRSATALCTSAIVRTRSAAKAPTTALLTTPLPSRFVSTTCGTGRLESLAEAPEHQSSTAFRGGSRFESCPLKCIVEGLHGVQRRSGIDQNTVAADPPPNDVRFVCQDLGSVFECRSTVRRERDLPDTNCTLDAMHAQSGRERGRVLFERRDEHGSIARKARCCSRDSRLNSRSKRASLSNVGTATRSDRPGGRPLSRRPAADAPRTPRHGRSGLRSL